MVASGGKVFYNGYKRRRGRKKMEHFPYAKYSYITKEVNRTLMTITNCGHQRCEAGYMVGPVIRDNYVIHYVVSGKGYYEVGEKKYTVTAGDAFIIYPHVVVRYYADQEDPWEYYWVGFLGADVKPLLSRTDFTAACAVISAGERETLKEPLAQIYQNSGEAFYNQVKMVGYLYLFLSELIALSHQKEQGVDISWEYVQKAVFFVAQNYEKPISVAEIADHLGVSRSHLYRVFVKHLSQSPKLYLEQFRIQQGKMMLKNTTMSINEVANSVGYDDPLYFSKVFKKLTGVSPTGYRKETMGKEI